MTDLSPEVEKQLASMSEGEFAALTAKVRAPDAEEQFREIAKRVVPEHFLDEFMKYANVAAFVTDGKIDEKRLIANLNVLKGSFVGQSWQGGTAGRAEGERRYGKGES